MNNRITKKHLQAIIGQLNRHTGQPDDYWADATGRRTAIGHYCLGQAYGGYELQQVVNESGGCRSISTGGHIPARELYGQISCAMLVSYQMRKPD